MCNRKCNDNTLRLQSTSLLITMNTTQSEEYDDYVKRKIWRPFLTDSSRNYEEESKTWKSFSQEETNNEQT